MKEGLLMCFMSTSMKNTGARTAGSLRVGEALSLSSMKCAVLGLSGKKKGSIATGDLNFTSTEAPEIMPPTSTEPINLDDPEVGMNPFSANFEGRGPSNDTINFEEDEHTTSSCSGQKVAGNGKKRKQSQVASVLQNFVDFRVKQTNDFMDELNENTKPNEDYSIKNCLAVLESIDELSEMEKAKAAKIFKCEQNREIFLNLKNPGVRLLWIQDEISPRPN